MGYATYDDFAARYVTRLSAAEVNSHFLPHAAARLEQRLAGSFTVPFSSNNVTATDLTIDLAYLLILQRSKEPQEYRALRDAVEARLDALAGGREAMITSSGGPIYGTPAAGDIWSSTATYRPVFGLRNAEEQSLDAARLADEEDA